MRFHWFLLVCYLLCPYGLKAQYGSLFGEETTAWTIRNSNALYWGTDSLVQGVDTAIAEMTFKKIATYSTLYEEGAGCPPHYLAEDTVSGRAWLFTALFPEPKLIMDLSLEVGEVFDLHSMGVMEVISTFADDQGRRVVEFDGSIGSLSVPEHVKFIEGYGPNIGPVYADWNCPSNDTYVLCHFKDGLIAGHADAPEFTGTCSYTTTGIISADRDGRIVALPNPTEGWVHIVDLRPQKWSLRVSNVLGRCIRSKEFFGTSVEFDLSNAPAGSYTVELVSASGRSLLRLIKL
ncbi:MAG TPA: T9SS type A sorting domain-containing protein [Flavobacteriales bacterium]